MKNGLPGEYGLHRSRKAAETLIFSATHLGQTCPRQCPPSPPASRPENDDPLGEPLTIREVANLIGCSPWTVRQRHLRAGLPHFRPSSNGKLIFYRNQVIHWLLKQQQKGGTTT